MFGYPCINMTLGEHGITTNRGMIKRTFEERGLRYVSELALKNCIDLLKIIQWNHDNNINLFRISSDIIPWLSEFEIERLPDFKEISCALSKVGEFASRNGHRLTSHPGPFNKLCSPKEDVVRNTIIDLENHGRIFNLIGLPCSHFSKINIHVGATYGDKLSAADTFVRNFDRLSDSVKGRLTLENDDRASMFAVSDLYNLIHKKTGIPIVIDYHHWEVSEDPMPWQEAFDMAYSTWKGAVPVIHYSNSRSIEQGNPKIKPQAHSDFYFKKLPEPTKQVHIMLESKMKELALKKYIQDFQ